MKKMKPFVCEEYGPPAVLQLKEVDKPVPADMKFFKPGDKVVGTADKLGAYGEYACRSDGLA